MFSELYNPEYNFKTFSKLKNTEDISGLKIFFQIIQSKTNIVLRGVTDFTIRYTRKKKMNEKS